MFKSEADSYKSEAIIIDPESKEKLGKISLVGEPVPISDWIDSKGPLQRFVIVEGVSDLRDTWYRQEEALLLTKLGQRYIRIVTYPTDGETEGYLDFTSEIKPYETVPAKSKLTVQRGLAYLQSLLGT